MTSTHIFRFTVGWLALAAMIVGCGGPSAAEAPEGDSGSRCERPDQCPEGQQCDRGGCVDPLPEGAPCERHAQCGTGSCVVTNEAGAKICD